ncbi:hypothetical protein CkaCkLH20_12373 [Colletotrichum karsti]|uniref:Carboxylesterase family protein n=1 Tax=Colletotrichum karsti TaxID=1095194 RepID=A0A9P6HTV8_9PEZI|nr:uncharacterized protein CkaCkLH20_12373 [Colletotrichum karsti]KAF9870139.1 hypothetical protein CkaCkLH20_12373 [Colletotrichum karsti]
MVPKVAIPLPANRLGLALPCQIQVESGDCSSTMVRCARSRAHAHDFDVVEDHTASASNQHALINANVTLSSNPFALLDRPDTNTDRSPSDFIDSLTDKLKELHIYSPEKNRGDTSLRERCLTRSTIHTEIFPPFEVVREEAEECDNSAVETTHAQGPFLAKSPRVTDDGEGDPSLAETHASTAAATRQAPFEASFPSEEHHSPGNNHCVQLSIARHKAGQYDYVLSVDASATRIRSSQHQGDSSQRYGCNLLSQRQYSPASVCSQGKAANAYRFLATPLGDEELVPQDASPILAQEENMAVAEPIVRLVSPNMAGNQAAFNKDGQSNVTVAVVEQTQQKSTGGHEHVKESSVEVIDHPKTRVISVSTDESSDLAPSTPSRSTSASSQSRIEDSLEAIDRLEEQLELVDAAITPPSKSRRHQMLTVESSSAKKTDIGRTGPFVKREQPTKAGFKPAVSQARAAQRQSIAVVTAKATPESPVKAVTKRASVSRPTSLLPPKSPAKSTKAPTKPSFELPGEAVARRLKEQREARRAAQETATAAAVPQRTRSTKAPTRPNFELPGERISQRKREEQQAKLKAEEERQRQRREFKARPIKANLNSASYPRETATSRARQGKGSEPVEVEQSPPKRSSILGTPRTPLTRSGSIRSPQSRGRGISQATTASEASRATSTSTSSMSGKRSTLSAEELEQQKLKGRAVFQRDNCYVEDKERERREREINAKLAREQAAERSRQASREWAEKQRQRRKELAAADAVVQRAN